jgi:hypothetical protein
MTAIGYISNTEQIIKAFWSNVQHVGVATFKLSIRSPLAPAFCAKDLPGGRTQVSIVCRMTRFDLNPAESDMDSVPESTSNSENWLTWISYLDHPNRSEEDWTAADESKIELGRGIMALESPAHCIVSVAPNVSGLIWPTQGSMKQVEKWLLTVSSMGTRRDKGNKKN